ncbi:YgdI/YgdR family lipoprotein [Erwinia tracheiphila]|uniref:Lipoprotein n=1 Tax=Erwinia tracheiphila TaxID=65700 RepID=A0A0M2KDL1_9GAMM|nr:YgdI/YgdR family lipoprotein [Erwinia tracheiphila]AXF76781.1 YgdI/YgdR family lipoprotein [Erwinia tracheiphila]EOS96002.1 hypothetical protein ETR_05363 [Erwinia tracheiphila PSU-1]KKF35422.1 lipoprotein [Erwinia tracheiphila]UIA84538.1 YgdI/YgdR family lipoprotein [Erwinia tracheiphila]UIA87084.1 YgdI/YgdR family lipoprotein [Erwinia tracheiphila]
MKWLVKAVALMLVMLVSGCSSDYVMATKDGKMIMTQGKPEIDKQTGLVKYTDNTDHELQINGDDISSIVER